MTCERYELTGGDLLIVEVQPAFSPPVRYRGRTFIRIGPRRDIATLDEERLLIEKRMSNMVSFDAAPCYKATLSDIDTTFIREEYIPKAVNQEEVSNDPRRFSENRWPLSVCTTYNTIAPPTPAWYFLAKSSAFFYPACAFNLSDSRGKTREATF